MGQEWKYPLPVLSVGRKPNYCDNEGDGQGFFETHLQHLSIGGKLMKIMVEISCPENWKEDHFLVVKGILEAESLIDVVSVEVA